MQRLLLASAAAAAMVLGMSVTTQVRADDLVHQQAAYGINGVGQKFALTDEERIIMRRYVNERSSVTTGASLGEFAVAPGDQIPDGVVLHQFPAAVYREAPELGS